MPQRFGFELRKLPVLKIKDQTSAGTLIPSGAARSYEASITLQPAQVIRFDFVADLSGGAFGDAYIFHLTQTRPDRQAEGGLTVVLVS
jgi:hypothetical protein